MQSQRRGLNRPLESWDRIKNGLIEVINTDKDIEREFFILSNKRLGQEVKNGEQFFQTLENNYAEHFHVVEFLINLTEVVGLHVDDGTTKVADDLRKYRNELKEYDIELSEKGLGTKCFVGREEELACIIQNLKTEKDRKELLICGMGGMGKTSLAVEVCRRLYVEDKWNAFKVDLREETTLCDLVRNTLTKFDERFSFSSTDYTANNKMGDTDLKYLQELLIQRCNEESSNTVLLLDNIDGILEKDRERLLLFVQKLLQKLNNNFGDCPFPSKMRIIFTARQKLIISKASDLLKGLIQVEIKGLNTKAAIELFTMSLEEQANVDTVSKIVEFCGNCPLAILSLCNSVRNSEMTPEKLLFNLQMTKNDAGGFESFGIESCLKHSFHILSEKLQQFLLQLSVFRTAQFDIHAAVAIAGRSVSSEKAATALDLVHLKSRHFVEVTIEAFSMGRSKAYSLHPLVVQFLIKKTKSMFGFDDVIKEARSRFIEHFDGVVQSLSLDLHRHPMESQRKLIENKTHIQSFFTYVINSEGKLRHACVDSPSVVGEFRRDELCSVILSDHERKDYYDQYIEYAKKNDFILDEIYFKTSKARLFFEIDRSDECGKLLNEVEDLVNRDNTLDEGTISPVLAQFYWMKGRFLNAGSHYKNALAMFEKSLSFYQRESELFKTDIANIYNSIGVLYCNQKEYDKSEFYHRKAVEMVKGQVGVDAKDTNIQVYYTNIATALFAQWQKQSKSSILEETNHQLLNQAKEYYTLAIYYDPKASESRAKKLENRGKLYLRMERYDDSEKDLLESLQIRKDILVPPNINLTHAYHNVGYFYVRKGNSPKTEEKAECFVQAAKYYEEAKFQIQRGGMTLVDPVYKDIVKFHKQALKALNDDRRLEQAKQFYQDFQSGKFNKKIRKWKSINKTMSKSKRMASTGYNFEKDSELDHCDSEGNASSDSSSSQSTLGEITDEEDGDNLSEESSQSQNEKSHDMVYGHKNMESLSSTHKDLSTQDGKIEQLERDILDSGIGSLTSSSIGCSSNTDDVVKKRRRLVSVASGSLEDNVFINCENP